MRRKIVLSLLVGLLGVFIWALIDNPIFHSNDNVITDFRHIVERQIYHAFAAPTIVLLVWWLFDMVSRKIKKFPRFTGWSAILTPVFVAYIIISSREIFDVFNGNWLWKSIIDWIVWSSGFIFAVWLLLWFSPTIVKYKRTIKRRSKR